MLSKIRASVKENVHLLHIDFSLYGMPYKLFDHVWEVAVDSLQVIERKSLLVTVTGVASDLLGC